MIYLYVQTKEGSGVTFVLLADESKMKVATAWEQDMSAAAENILLEAVHLGLGGVWLGVATVGAVMDNVRDLLGLPKTFVRLR